MLLAALLLLLGPLAAGATWCDCVQSTSGSFSDLLSIQNASDVSVWHGKTLVDSSPRIFSAAANPQALVQYLANTYANGAQAVAASQLLSRCTRYDRGGFRVVVITGFVIAARLGSFLTWLQIEMDLYSTCTGTARNVFRSTPDGIRIVPIDLRALDTQADPWGPLVDSAETICRPRAPLLETGSVLWLNKTYDRYDVQSGLQWWLHNRTQGDMLQRLRICGPRSTDAREGLFYARGTDRRYVQVCSFEDAMFCASDAMLLNTPIAYGDTSLFGVALDSTGSMVTRGTHLKRFQIAVGIDNHLVNTVDFISQGAVMQTVTAMTVSSSTINSSTILLAVYALNISNMMQETDRIFGHSPTGFTDCVFSMETIHEHTCDPLVMHDKHVLFGTHDTTGGLTMFISGTHGTPCTPAITSVCPAVHLPSPSFSGATIAGIVMGAFTWTLIAIMAGLLLYEWPFLHRRIGGVQKWLHRPDAKPALSTGSVAKTVEAPPKPLAMPAAPPKPLAMPPEKLPAKHKTRTEHHHHSISTELYNILGVRILSR